MSTKFKKILFISNVFALSSMQNVFASIKDIHEYLDFDTDVRVAADALASAIREDENGNHSPIPGHNAYRDLKIVSIDPNYSGTVEIDDEATSNSLRKIEISTISFQAKGVPLFSSYSAQLKMSVSFTADCTKIADGTRDYVILSSNSSLVDRLFKKDLTGSNYKNFSYGDSVFESVLKTNEKLRALCPNFIPHKTK